MTELKVGLESCKWVRFQLTIEVLRKLFDWLPCSLRCLCGPFCIASRHVYKGHAVEGQKYAHLARSGFYPRQQTAFTRKILIQVNEGQATVVFGKTGEVNTLVRYFLCT